MKPSHCARRNVCAGTATLHEGSRGSRAGDTRGEELEPLSYIDPEALHLTPCHLKNIDDYEKLPQDAVRLEEVANVILQLCSKIKFAPLRSLTVS